MSEPSEVLAGLDRNVRFEVGGVLLALADQLGTMTADEVAAFGVVVMGQATGLMVPAEVTPTDVDAALVTLSRRMADYNAAAREVDDDG